MILPDTPDLDLAKSHEKTPKKPWTPKGAYGEGSCPKRFTVPDAPLHATDLNGVALRPVCIQDTGALHHVFVIGDWGGVVDHPWNHTFPGPVPADHRSKLFPAHHRKFVVGADDIAQYNVAAQMKLRAPTSKPDYVLNVGDNFYWGGIMIKCGAPPDQCKDDTGQWKEGYEDIYSGQGLDGVQWLGVLGNHDFGGFLFTNGWDQAIAYTWAQNPSSTNRWVTPAMYYSSRVHYPDFAVDYYFMDSNVFDAFAPDADPGHNICSKKHNQKEAATCGLQGPVSVEECPRWFKRLWDAQVEWLEQSLAQSIADWQVVVTHFPPEKSWGADIAWARLSKEYGIDLFVTGHRHSQEVHYLETSNALRPTAYIVSGGGGGITSEGLPTASGDDDEYGFMDLTLSSTEIRIDAISHGGQLRSATCVRQRMPGGRIAPASAGPSLCDGAALGSSLSPALATEGAAGAANLDAGAGGDPSWPPAPATFLAPTDGDATAQAPGESQAPLLS
eukprot:CAMPEP_0180430302 /NCGR_PEP_ID=MMETSP1036_2-20121128/7815_1 /TAXON_ID=632150 /ORGANISM="Azadinium spinosum, Strain 3D9" /LENGTH=500 /DNA_ID=CAMNT_0022436031 /DNA_START=39 /DNA_END=1541 /DNA_ORIENTATION=-